MVKMDPRTLKIGVQSHFHPISTIWGFALFSSKILAWPSVQYLVLVNFKRRKEDGMSKFSKANFTQLDTGP